MPSASVRSLLTQAQVGKAITVVASYTDGHGAAERVSSASTAAVVKTFSIAFGTVNIGHTITDFTAGAGGDVIDFTGISDLSTGGNNAGFAVVAAPKMLTNGMNVLTAATAATISATDIAAATVGYTDIMPDAKFYIALNVTDIDSVTPGSQAGAVLVRYDNINVNTQIQSNEVVVVATLVGVDVKNLSAANFTDFS
jgi:hypothetical protein